MVTTTDERSTLPKDRLWQPVTARWFLVVFGVTLAYAVLRYHIAGETPWSHFPLFILNKAVSLASVVFVAASYLVGRVIRWYNHDPALRLVVVKFCGLIGLSLAAVHVFFSLCVLDPAYFGKFYGEDGRLNLVGELGLAVGVIALWALAVPAITTLPMMPKAIGGIRWKRTQRMGYVCLLLVVAHMVVFGLKGWLTPQKWPSGLPPITMLAAAVAVVPLVAKLGRRRWSRDLNGTDR